MNTGFLAVTMVTNILCIFIGFMLGDEDRHERDEVADEASFTRHSQQAMWVARRTR